MFENLKLNKSLLVNFDHSYQIRTAISALCDSKSIEVNNFVRTRVLISFTVSRNQS